jgi:7-cyano-7-deazaguanosine (preQ0) biosynthesis protein QueE
MLKVSKGPEGHPEIFYSIQGEGANIGKPAVFLRLGLCNLKCEWCDTKYTWDWAVYKAQEQLVELSLEDIERGILNFNCKYLVITGGEPLIQQAQIIPLLESLKNQGFFIEIETNGTILPDQRVLGLVDHWSVSPKLQNSGNSKVDREIDAVYKLFNTSDSSHFKYVLQNEIEFEEVQQLVKQYNINPHKMILMPEAGNKTELLARSRWLVELCKTGGYMFSLRLHILLWGNERGK